MDSEHLHRLKSDYEEAEHAAMHARDVAARAVQQLESGSVRDVPPELATTLRELEDLAVERQRVYLTAISEDLLCTQADERRKKAAE